MVFTHLYSAFKNTYKWLDKSVKEGKWTKFDQDWYDATEYLNPFIRMYKDQYMRERYLDRNNLDYSDIRQPWNLPGNSPAGNAVQMIRGGYNFFSNNVESLYDDEDPREAHRRALMEKYYRADFRR